MSWFTTRLPRRKPVRFTPKIDALEDRCTPAVAFNVQGDTLFASGDAGNNYILITDKGDGSVGNIQVHTEDGLFTPAPLVAIKRIVVDAGAGNDSVSYTVQNNFNSEMTVDGTMGEGNDSFVAQLRQVQANARLRFSCFGGNGNDFLIAQFLNSIQNGASIDWRMLGEAGDDRASMTLTGNMLNNAILNSNVELGTGDDGWDALIQGSMFSGAQATFNALGGVGNDVVDSTFRTSHLGGSRTRINYMGETGLDNVRINAGSNVDVEAAAELTFQLNGGADADFMLLQHGGRINGLFNGLMNGESGNDNVRGTQLLSSGSNPTRNTDVWRVEGSDGNDTLLLQIFPPAEFPSDVVNGRIIGGNGFDTCIRTRNVSVSSCEA